MTNATESAERVHALLTLYRESHYDVVLPRGGAATIRVGTEAPAALRRWMGGDDSAFYLTACNPRSHSLPPAENRRRLDALLEELRRRACRYLEGAGHIPGESWREESVMVAGLADGDVAELVREHDQNSVVVVRSGVPATLRIYRPDWQALVGTADDIEWAAR